jgi:nucleotide-binding universal stress UspA family protein
MVSAIPERRPVALKPPFIVVGVDGSPGSRAALRWALVEAMARGASLEAVLVWTDPWVVDGPPTLAGLGAEAREELQERLARAVREAVAEVGAERVYVAERVMAGHAAEVLAQESADALLLVVGSRGLGGFRGLFVGSVSTRCSQLARVPLLIVPDPAARKLQHPVHAH